MEKRNKKKVTTLFVVLTALFAALIFAITFFIPVPIGPIGYVNFGDAVIFLAAFVLGPVGGAAAGSVGSMLADLLLGYAQYAPFTFVIKGLEGFLCGAIYHYALKKSKNAVRRAVALALSSLWAIIGYFVADTVLYGVAAAFANLLPMLLQVGVSVIVALVVMPKVPAIYDDIADRLFVTKKDETYGDVPTQNDENDVEMKDNTGE